MLAREPLSLTALAARGTLPGRGRRGARRRRAGAARVRRHRRHGRREDDAARRVARAGAAGRAARRDRGRRRDRARPPACGAAGDPHRQRRRGGRDRAARSGPPVAADAARPAGRRRVPRCRDGRAARGPEHRARGRGGDAAREQCCRRAGPPRRARRSGRPVARRGDLARRERAAGGDPPAPAARRCPRGRRARPARPRRRQPRRPPGVAPRRRRRAGRGHRCSTTSSPARCRHPGCCRAGRAELGRPGGSTVAGTGRASGAGARRHPRPARTAAARGDAVVSDAGRRPDRRVVRGVRRSRSGDRHRRRRRGRARRARGADDRGSACPRRRPAPTARPCDRTTAVGSLGDGSRTRGRRFTGDGGVGRRRGEPWPRACAARARGPGRSRRRTGPRPRRDADLAALEQAWRVAATTGAPLAEVWSRVARDLNQQVEQRRAVAGALAGARSSAALLAGLPVVGVLLGTAMQAQPLHVLAATSAGHVMLLLGVCLDAAGLGWTHWLTARAEAP